MKKPLVVLLAFGLAGLTSGCAQEKMDPRKLADALSEELTDELEFDNGTKQAGPPPEEHADDPNYPQIEAGGLEGPLMVQYGVDFNITLYSNFTMLDEIVGAVVHVEQANKTDVANSYIEIIPPSPPPPMQTGSMTLTGRVVNPSPPLGGNSFILNIALIRDDGAGLRGVGNYATMPLVTPPIDGVTPKVPQCHCSELEDLGEIVIVGACNDTEITSRIEWECCFLFAEAFLGHNSSFLAWEDLTTNYVDLPAGTQAVTMGSPPCTLQLNCP
jgi:hypothetical protein